MQENGAEEIKVRKTRRSREEIAELVREYRASGQTQLKFCEERGIKLGELQRSLKIVRRISEPQLMAVEMESVAAENAIRPVALGRKNWIHFRQSGSRPSDRRHPLDRRNLQALENPYPQLSRHCLAGSSRPADPAGWPTVAYPLGSSILTNCL
jgi:hypothetical protein